MLRVELHDTIRFLNAERDGVRGMEGFMAFAVHFKLWRCICMGEGSEFRSVAHAFGAPLDFKNRHGMEGMES